MNRPRMNRMPNITDRDRSLGRSGRNGAEMLELNA
jgi:hypothetical protein